MRARLFRGVSFERSVSRRVVPWGGDLEVALSITNDKLLPLVWLQVRDQWPAGVEPLGYTLNRTLVLDRQELVETVSVRWFERLRRRYRVRCTARGVHRFGPADVQAGDPFGIAGVGTRWEEQREVVVLPRVLDVPGLALLRGRPLVEEQAERSLALDPTALRGVRPYLPGDPVRALNWRATARTGVLHTNEFDPSSQAAVRLLLDLGSLYRSWEAIEAELMELLCVVAASLAASFDGRGVRRRVRDQRDGRAGAPVRRPRTRPRRPARRPRDHRQAAPVHGSRLRLRAARRTGGRDRLRGVRGDHRPVAARGAGHDRPAEAGAGDDGGVRRAPR